MIINAIVMYNAEKNICIIIIKIYNSYNISNVNSLHNTVFFSLAHTFTYIIYSTLCIMYTCTNKYSSFIYLLVI